MKRVEFNTIQGSAPLYINTGLKVKSVEMKIFAYACIHTYVRMYVHKTDWIRAYYNSLILT